MTQQVALYGFIRRKDGLRVHPRGIDNARCFLFHGGGQSAAVVSLVKHKNFNSNPANMVRHEEVVEKIFSRQVFLPVKFPKLLVVKSLRKSMVDLDREISRVLQKIIFKAEYHVKVFLLDSANPIEPSGTFNAFSKYIMEHSSQYRYKHYFPILTKEAKEAEFLHYAEQVVNHISQKLCNRAMYWRAKSFCSEKILLDSIFWVRRHRTDAFLQDVKDMKSFYPNLKISVLGPRPPYNFVKIDIKDHV